MKHLTDSMLDALSREAQQSSRRRANHNLREDLSDPVQRLAIAMEPDTFVRPHRGQDTDGAVTSRNCLAGATSSC